jgi:hypothetical protein
MTPKMKSTLLLPVQSKGLLTYSQTIIKIDNTTSMTTSPTLHLLLMLIAFSLDGKST